MNRKNVGYLKLLLLLNVLLLAACASSARFESTRDSGVEIAAFETFRIERHAAANEMQPQVTAAQELIESFIQDELVSKGYRPVESGEDFVVDYVMYVESYYQEGGHDRYFLDERVGVTSGSEAKLANPVEVGTLHIHLMHPQQGGPFFESIGKEVIERAEIDKGHVRRAIARMLAGVPEQMNGGTE